METSTLIATVPPEMAGNRLDRVLTALFPAYSRACLQRWLREGHATVDGHGAQPKDRVRGGERVELQPHSVGHPAWSAQALPLGIVYEDADLIVIDKPPGLVVHPGAGNPDRTLVNGLLAHDPALAAVPRAGIVHRLDKDTSGLLAVARTLPAHKSLVDQLKNRTMHRTYQAVVSGVLASGGTVEAPVGRHRIVRTRMAVTASGKPARTRYRVMERFHAHTHVRLTLDTGRTHQIRVHMAHIGHPVVGDPVYGRPSRPRGSEPAHRAVLLEHVRRFPRQALHASALALAHPRSGRPVRLESPLPSDLQELLATLQALEAAA
jgi:23S rRNA pseudouridine1911/1915/1917 synthase